MEYRFDRPLIWSGMYKNMLGLDFSSFSDGNDQLCLPLPLSRAPNFLYDDFREMENKLANRNHNNLQASIIVIV